MDSGVYSDQRYVLSKDDAEFTPTEEQLERMKRIGTEHMTCLVENVLEDELEYNENMNTWQLKPESDTSKLAVFIHKTTGYVASTIQKRAPDSVGRYGVRTSKNYSLCVFPFGV